MSDDLERLKAEYGRRAESPDDRRRYSLFNSAHLFAVQQRQRQTLQMLRRRGLETLAGKRVLEVGCGRGGILHEYLGYGVTARDLVGIDLLEDRLTEAQARLPGVPLANCDARRLPFDDATFDLVLQYTAFSSVLDDTAKAAMAAEMRRVLRPDGLILWYDFWINPTNPQVRGIHPDEVRRLFAGCRCEFRRITLAPPLARRLVPLSWTLALLLEKLRLLNTHDLALIE